MYSPIVRRLRALSSIPLILAAAALQAVTPVRAIAQSGVNVITQHYDNGRTGANLNEQALTTSNVDITRFGKLFVRAVDAQIFAQPLIVSGLEIPNLGTRNVVYVATQNNSVYAFDADDPAVGAPLWTVNLGSPVSPAPITGIAPGMGITSTPVIDLNTKTIYVCCYVKTSTGRQYYLHALDIIDGHPKFGSPVKVAATFAGIGDASVGGILTFNAFKQNQRASLLQANGRIYLAFASFNDINPYHAWIIGYDPSDLTAPPVVANLTPDGKQGGIWQAGQGPAADDQGNIWVTLGNGTFSVRSGGRDFGNSFVKLSTANGGLTPVDFFTPFNVDDLNARDLDVGASGPMLIPNTNLVVGGGKSPYLFVMDRSNMGGFNPLGNTGVLQQVFHTGRHLHGSPVFWNSPTGGMVYIWPEVTNGQQFPLINGRLNAVPSHVTRMNAPNGMPGGMLSISANGSQPGTGILWVNIPASAKANKGILPGIIRAFDASDISRELWDSKKNEARDDSTTFSRFVAPVVANGKVYIATHSNQLIVYGLLPHQVAPFSPYAIEAIPDVGKISLSWTASIGSDYYKIKRGTTPGGPYEDLASNVQTTSYVDSNVVTGQRYYYIVVAVNSGGDSPNSDEASAAAGTSKMRLGVAADTYVRSGNLANHNYGRNVRLPIRRSGIDPAVSDVRIIYQMLDLTSITSNPVSAYLTLTVDSMTVPRIGVDSIQLFTEPDSTWTELGLIYNNAPGLDRATATSTGTKIMDKRISLDAAVVNFDVTDFVKQNRGTKATLQLFHDKVNMNSIVFLSHRALTGKPVLTLIY